MIIKEKKIVLENKKECIIRSPRKEDAKELVDFLRGIVEETPFLLNTVEETRFTIEQEEAFIQSFLDSPTNLMIVAVVDGKIAGNCSFTSVGNQLKIKHRCNMGIALYKKYWGLGIGASLIQCLKEKAKNYGYEQMELDVIKDNTRAIALYEKMGFVKVGEIPRAFKYSDGTYADEVKMVNVFH